MAIPPYYPNGLPSGVLFSGTSGATDFTTAGVSVQGYRWLSFMFTWASFNQTDATVSFEVSNDDTNWDEKSDAAGDPVTFTIGTASGTQGVSFNGVVTEAFYRVVFSNGTNSAGTISCSMVGKN